MSQTAPLQPQPPHGRAQAFNHTWGFIALFIGKGPKTFGNVCQELGGEPGAPPAAGWRSLCATIPIQPVPCCPHAPNAGAKTPPDFAPRTPHAAIARSLWIWHVYQATQSLPRWPPKSASPVLHHGAGAAALPTASTTLVAACLTGSSHRLQTPEQTKTPFPRNSLLFGTFKDSRAQREPWFAPSPAFGPFPPWGAAAGVELRLHPRFTVRPLKSFNIKALMCRVWLQVTSAEHPHLKPEHCVCRNPQNQYILPKP